MVVLARYGLGDRLQLSQFRQISQAGSVQVDRLLAAGIAGVVISVTGASIAAQATQGGELSDSGGFAYVIRVPITYRRLLEEASFLVIDGRPIA